MLVLSWGALRSISLPSTRSLLYASVSASAPRAGVPHLPIPIPPRTLVRRRRSSILCTPAPSSSGASGVCVAVVGRMSSSSSSSASPGSTSSATAAVCEPGTVDLPELFRQVCCLPDVTAASWLSNGHEQAPDVLLTTTQRDIQLDAKRMVQSHYRSIDGPSSPLSYAPTYSAPVTDIVATVPSPSGKLILYIKKGPTKPGASKDAPPNFVLDVVTRTGRLVLSKHTDKHHGRIITGGILGGIAWSADETRVVYVADQLQVSAQSFYATENDPKSAHLPRGTEFEYKEDWGEVLTGVFAPRVYMLHVVQTTPSDHNTPSLIQGHITALEGIPEGITLGQVVHVPDNSGVLVTGWMHAPRKLGLIHYNTRESAIYYLPFSSPEPQPALTSTVALPIAAANSVASYVKPDDKKKDTGNGSGNGNGEVKKEDTDAEKEKEQEKEDKKKASRLIQLTPQDWSAMNPRFSPDGTQLAYLTTDRVWYHRSCARLRILDWHALRADITDPTTWSDKATDSHRTAVTAAAPFHTRTAVDVVHFPQSVSSFPGLWTLAGLLPDKVWLHDSRHVVVTSEWRSRDSIIVIDTHTGLLTRIPPPSSSVGQMYEHGCAGILDLTVQPSRSHTWVLFSLATPVLPVAVYAARLDVVDGRVEATWTLVHGSATIQHPVVASSISSISFDVVDISPSTAAPNFVEAKQAELPFDAILLKPPTRKDGAKSPLIVFPHGGPHGSFSTAFYPSSLLFALYGFGVLHINFRGSTGFGQAALESLPGRCGRQDIDDCMDAVKHILANYSQFDEQQLSIFGGSHGGFITCHLIGQYPDMFRAAVARNPVTNVAHNVQTTDIPDWCTIESGIPYSPATGYTAEQYKQMFEMSPIALIDRVKTPLCIMIGTTDRRVPMTQGIDFYRILRARGQNARLHVYPENQHSLADRVAVEANNIIASALWLSGKFEHHDLTWNQQP